jgi:hypothetical protein
MAANPITPGSPYPVILELNVTDTCFKNCGRVSYPSQGLSAPMSNLIPVDPARLPEVKGPNGTGRCWQLNEDYSDECFGTDPGRASLSTPFSSSTFRIFFRFIEPILTNFILHAVSWPLRTYNPF